MANENNRIGKVIRDIRQYLGCVEHEFARKIGISQSYLSAIELGKVSVPEKVIAEVSRVSGAKQEEIRNGRITNWTSIW